MNEIENLFRKMEFISYPNTMSKITGEIKRQAFFPGGKGTWDLSDRISDKKIMVLGQDFDTKEKFEIYQKEVVQDINKNVTWRNLFELLNDFKIDKSNCFFTNVIMGARNDKKATGKSPGFKDKKYIEDCQKFFLIQLETQKPELILVMGKCVAEFLSSLSEELSCWKGIKSIEKSDKNNTSVHKGVIFLNGISSSVVLLLHPSFRKVNLKRRKFKTFNDKRAEQEMVNSVYSPNN